MTQGSSETPCAFCDGVGLGYAMGINEAGPDVYWVQVFAAPRP